MRMDSRNGSPIDLIVLHDPEGANTASELYSYLQGIDGGYHSLDDDNQEIIAAPDNVSVWGAGGVNERSLHICFVPGRAAWSRAEWLTHTAAINRGAARAAMWSRLYGIPAVHLTPAQVASVGTKGVCTHGDVTAAGYTASEGHTDPGSNFPMDVFIAAMQSVLNPGLSPADKARLIAEDEWRHRVHAHPLKYGDQNHDVAILINQFRRHHFLPWWARGSKFGKMVRTANVKFKDTIPELRDQPAPEKGENFGGDAADALVGLG
jgi:hypothetical protein